jgi:hypothetical protein
MRQRARDCFERRFDIQRATEKLLAELRHGNGACHDH